MIDVPVQSENKKQQTYQIRLDAVGHAVKRAGTSCFMIPETFAFIADLTAEARARGMEVLVEVHGYYQEQIAIARQVDRVYDNALPPLVLHAFRIGLGDRRFDATHISLATSALPDLDATNALSALIPLIGRIQIRVESTEP